MPGWFWIIANGLIGIPLALVAVTLVREGVRAGLAPLLGFRVFEVQWGVGRPVASAPVGPLDVVLACWPLGGATIARSGSPQRHRLGRVLLAIAPLLAQLAWLAGRALAGTRPGAAPLFDGAAPLACLDLANTLLLVGHATIAVELSERVRTDARLLLDALLGRADSDRAARADYYARLAILHLDRSKVDAARSALVLGLRQLGPVPLLVECRDRLDARDLASVVDQGECADALRDHVRAAEPRRRIERLGWSTAERARQTFFSGLPVTLALLTLFVVQADRLARSVEDGFGALAERFAAAGDAARCTGLRDRWSAWSTRTDPWLPPSPAERSARHLGLARLERCRGDVAAAAAHQGEALLAANAARRDDAGMLLREPHRWLENELRVALLLRQNAELEHERRAHRDALRALGRAERRLEVIGSQLALIDGEEMRVDAAVRVEEERERILAARERVLTGMASR